MSSPIHDRVRQQLDHEIEVIDARIAEAEAEANEALVDELQRRREQIQRQYTRRLARAMTSRAELSIVPADPPPDDADEDAWYGSPKILERSVFCLGLHLLADTSARSQGLVGFSSIDALTEHIKKRKGLVIVGTEGRLWRYDGGIWSPVPKDEQDVRMSGYFNVSVTGGKPMKLTSFVIEDAIQCAFKKVHVEDFFKVPVRGIAFANGFVELDLSDPNGDYLRFNEHSPTHRCRAGYTFDLPDDAGHLVNLPTSADSMALHPEWVARMPTYLTTCYGAWLRGNTSPELDARFMQEWEGLSMLGQATTFGKALFIRGTEGTDIDAGSNGKSTYYAVLAQTFPDGAVVPELDLSSWKNPYDKTGLMGGKLLGLMDEVSKLGAPAEVRRVITGGDINARLTGSMSSPSFTYKPVAGIALAGHELPKVYHEDMNGLPRRFVFVNFPNVFRGSNLVDPARIMAGIRQEMPWIVLWRLAGALRALRHGYTMPGDQDAALAEFSLQNDPIRQFWEECIVVDAREDKPTRTRAGLVWDRFLQWAEHGKVRISGLNHRVFGKRFKAIALKSRVTHDPNNKIYRGLRFKLHEESLDESTR